MKYKISTKCCWFRGGSMIVKMYFINGMPFTFDELPDGHLRDADLIKEADESRTFNDDDLKCQKVKFNGRPIALVGDYSVCGNTSQQRTCQPPGIGATIHIGTRRSG